MNKKNYAVEIALELESLDPLNRMMHSEHLNPGHAATIEEGKIRLQLTEIEEGHGFGGSTVVKLLIEFGTDVSSHLVADALLAGLGLVVRRITVRGRKVRATKAELEQALDEDRSG